MRSEFFYFTVAVALFLAFFSGCVETGTNGSDALSDSQAQVKASADSLFNTGMSESVSGNCRGALAGFDEAMSLYKSIGLKEEALMAKNQGLIASRTILEYSLNETEAKVMLREKVSGITDSEIDDWLLNSAQKIVSDGETFYYGETAANYLYANYELLQKEDIIDFDYVTREVFSGRMPDSDSAYFNPVYYRGTEKCVIPGEVFTGKGIVKVWFPLPLETESQNDVSVSNFSYEEYIVYGPITEGQIGYVYYEIPAEKIEGDLVLTADIGFKSYEQGFYVDPDMVLTYNTTDPEYILYTASARDIEITDEIKAKALEIIGDEKNPYLQAVMIYSHIIETYPYSHVPHLSLDTAEPKVAESTYMFNTGHGDCGTQSMLFSAMCRSLGIPARATGGYQMILQETPGTHFWAEYYIEGYGWIPCDPTVAEVADWVDITGDERARYKEYFAHNLDNSRFVIQKDVDAEMTPAIPEDAVVLRLVRQNPAVIYDESDEDVDLIAEMGFMVDLKADLP
ncbi:MAG: transglutaminase domain-containing protein [Methanomicrobiaceae archaeon]|nr:transglutaminase domain-containing protein [Methanomicrobiaceae archaeon]